VYALPESVGVLGAESGAAAKGELVNVRDPGHDYVLASLDGDAPQRLTFVKREGPGFPGNVGAHPGTTTQEVLRALIDRGKYVNNQIPCAETEAATELMKSALLLLELRAARRHGRVAKAFDTLDEAATTRETCPRCGHVGCDGCRQAA
jgi:hypothetical protein